MDSPQFSTGGLGAQNLRQVLLFRLRFFRSNVRRILETKDFRQPRATRIPEKHDSDSAE
jgi:hypothetical protein